MRPLLALVLLACLALAPVASAQQDLTRDQVAAYVALTKADRARDRGESLPALAGYEEALTKYTGIKQRDPRWHPDVVQYRIQYCLQELDKLKAPKAPAEPPPEVKPAPAPSPDEPAEPAPEVIPSSSPPVESPVLEQEVQALRAQVTDLQAALVITQKLAQLEQDQAAVVAERDQLRARVAELESAPRMPDRTEELRQLEEQLKQERERGQGEVESLRKQVDDVTRERDERAAALAKLEASVERRAQREEKRNAKLEAEQKAVEQELEQVRRQVTEANAAVEQAQAERDQARQEVEQVRTQQGAAGQQEQNLQAELAQARADTKAAREALEQCKTQAETRLRAYEAAQRERDDLEPQVREAHRQMVELQASLKALRDKESTLTEGWKKQVDDLRKEVARLKAGVPTSSDMEQALNDQIESLTRQLRAVRDEAGQREAKLQELTQENERLKAGR